MPFVARLLAWCWYQFPKTRIMYGQKKFSKDLHDEPLDEFITQTSNNLADTANQTPVKPGAAKPDGVAAREEGQSGDTAEAREIDEEGMELPKKMDAHKAGDAPQEKDQ